MVDSTGRESANSIGYNIAAIHNLILQAFTAEELLRFCRDRPVFRAICDEFGPGHGLNDMVDRVITYCRTQLLWEELLEAVAQENPRQYARFESILRGPEYISHPQPSEEIGRGFVALTELLHVPKVRDAVVTFRTDFRAAREQVALLTGYKQLHDLLHELQFYCYSPILQAARRFPHDDLAVEDLEYYELTFQRIIGNLNAISGDAVKEVSGTLWIHKLIRSRQSLRDAIRESDVTQLKEAIWLLNRVLATEPSRINTHLTAAARAIRLPALVEAITEVCDSLACLDVDLDKASQFQLGMRTLTILLGDLTTLVGEHDSWQVVDLELRRIEANMGQATMELERSWPELKATAEPLYSGRSEEWAVSFRQDSENLEKALAEANPAYIKRCFRRYRRRAGSRFHQVDVDLKGLCEDLSKVGEPLTVVMRMMQ